VLSASSSAAGISTAARTRVQPDLVRPERRSSTRLRFLKSWQKVVTPEWERGAEPDSIEPHSRVQIFVARAPSLVRAQSSFQILTDDDRRGLALLRTKVGRDCALAATILLRLSLSQAVEPRIEPRAWAFQRSSFGKLSVVAPPLDINFSISHTDALTVVAISSEPLLGIDVELTDQELQDSVMHNFCHANEHETIKALPDHQRSREFVRYWTQKEAFTKLLGCGHSVEFSTIETPLHEVHDDSRSSLPSSVHFENFYVPVDHALYHMSLAIDKPTVPVDIQLVDVTGPSGANWSPASMLN
jgi:phosphopantetheinyl transferase